MAQAMVPPSEDSMLRVLLPRLVPEVRVEGARSVVVLRGVADISTRDVVAQVLSRVIGYGTGDVVIDLSEATFIDRAIVRALVTAKELLDHQDRVLTFRSPSLLARRVLNVFQLAGLTGTEESDQQ